MTRILLVLGFFLFSLSGIAQEKKISKAEFERLVDYANSKYAMAYMEASSTSENYKEKIKPALQKTNLDNFNTILDYNGLKNLLKGNSSALNLIDEINKRKQLYDSSKSDEELIGKLKAGSWKGVNLTPTATVLMNACYKKYGIKKATSAQEIIQEQILQASSQIEALQSEVELLQKEYQELKNDSQLIEYESELKKIKYAILGALIAIGILFVAFFILLFTRNKGREYIIEQVLSSERIAKKFSSPTNQPFTTTPKPVTQNDVVRMINQELERRFSPQRTTMISSDIPSQKVSGIKTPQFSQPSKYLKGKSGKAFTIVESTPENSFFRLINEEGETAGFEFCGDEAKAIAKRAFNEEIANIISGNYDTANHVYTHKPGKVQFVGGQWEVIEPIEIKLS